MGLQPSKFKLLYQQVSNDELLYQQVSNGNINAIISLHADGASLEWIDNEGKTPLCVACMKPELYIIAKTLIDLGADINTYPPGYFDATSMHHVGEWGLDQAYQLFLLHGDYYAAPPMYYAAERGLDRTVQLLLSHGANALLIHSGRTPLDVARSKGHTKVVRTIEAHICLFSGWLTELGITDSLLLSKPFDSREVWVVVLPSESHLKLELAMYTDKQHARPQTIVTLWTDMMREPNFNYNEPVLIGSAEAGVKLTSLSEDVEHNLRSFCNACKGIPQQVPPYSEQVELDMAIQASLHSFTQQSPHPGFGANASSSTINQVHVVHTSVLPYSEQVELDMAIEASLHSFTQQSPHLGFGANASSRTTIPSAPFAMDDICTSPSVERSDTKPNVVKDDGTSSCCVICLDAQVEGAFIPCGQYGRLHVLSEQNQRE